MRDIPGVVLIPYYSNGINEIILDQLISSGSYRKVHGEGWGGKTGKAVWRGSPTGGVMFDRLINKKTPISPRGAMCAFSSTEKGKKLVDFAFSANLHQIMMKYLKGCRVKCLTMKK
jgi:hypothetical protein